MEAHQCNDGKKMYKKNETESKPNKRNEKVLT